MNTPMRTLAAAGLATLLGACGRPASEFPPQSATDPAPAPAPAAEATAGEAPADAFLAAIAGHCGQAFAGRIVANEPPPPEDPFTGKALLMHVRECGPDEVKIPFHVGDDRSRTWVLSRDADGLRLAHDHRHEDGSPDDVTLYGGVATTPGTAVRQEFPADGTTRTLFGAHGLAASLSNVWAMEIEPGKRFLYELARPDGRLFQVEFDLTAPVPEPPAPWGH